MILPQTPSLHTSTNFFIEEGISIRRMDPLVQFVTGNNNNNSNNNNNNNNHTCHKNIVSYRNSILHLVKSMRYCLLYKNSL